VEADAAIADASLMLVVRGGESWHSHLDSAGAHPASGTLTPTIPSKDIPLRFRAEMLCIRDAALVRASRKR
jgi:hypothetical protein